MSGVAKKLVHQIEEPDSEPLEFNDARTIATKPLTEEQELRRQANLREHKESLIYLI